MPPSSPSYSPTGRVRRFVFPRNFDLKEIEYASAASAARLCLSLLFSMSKNTSRTSTVAGRRILCRKDENNHPCPRELILTKAYSLDTSTCIDVIRNTNLKARQQFEHAVIEGHEIVISSIALHELTFGVSRSKHPQRSSAALNFFLGGVSVLDLTADDAVSSGHIRANLTNGGTSIGPFDTLIAGQALRRNLIMVTGNVKEFSRVKRLVVVNWSR